MKPGFLLLLFLLNTALAQPAPAESESVRREYRRLLASDDAATAKIRLWIHDSQDPDTPETRQITLAGRIQTEVEPVLEAYHAFIDNHPNHAQARLSFASFLTDIGRHETVLPHLLKATELAPELPGAWNNLANHYGYQGDPEQAFRCYEKALALAPQEPLYYQNYAAAVFLFRQDAGYHFQLEASGVLAKVLELYGRAQELDPDNFLLAEKIAQTHYSLPAPGKPQAALQAWKKAESLAPGEFERQGVALHLARIYLQLDNPDQARQELEQVYLPIYERLKEQIGQEILSPPPPTVPDP